jgi:hypothetical protein
VNQSISLKVETVYLSEISVYSQRITVPIITIAAGTSNLPTPLPVEDSCLSGRERVCYWQEFSLYSNERVISLEKIFSHPF